MAGRQEGNPGDGHHPCCAALRSEAVLVCSSQDLTRPDLRPGTASCVHIDERRAQQPGRRGSAGRESRKEGQSSCRGLKKEQQQQQQQHGRIQQGRKGLDGSGCFCQLRRHSHQRKDGRFCLSLPATSRVPSCRVKCIYKPVYLPSTCSGRLVDHINNGRAVARRQRRGRGRRRTGMGGWPHRKGAKAVAVTAQPSPAQAAPTPSPAPRLPQLPAPISRPCPFPAGCRACCPRSGGSPRSCRFRSAATGKGLGGSRPKPNELAHKAGRGGKTPLSSFSFDGGLARCETKAARPSPPLPLRNQRRGPAFGAPAGK